MHVNLASHTCGKLASDTYTLMVPCEMLLFASNVTNSSSVYLLAGMQVMCVPVQEVVKFSTLPSMLLWLSTLVQE